MKKPNVKPKKIIFCYRLFLQVLDHEKVIHESTGKKYVTMPSLIFYKDHIANTEKNKSRRKKLLMVTEKTKHIHKKRKIF